MEPVATDQAAPPPPDKIIPEAYGMLAFVFMALLAMTLYSVFSKKGPAGQPSLTTESVNAKFMLGYEALIALEKKEGASASGSEMLRKQTDESYRSVIDSVEKKANAPEAGKLLVGLYSASGRAVPTRYAASTAELPPAVVDLLFHKSRDPKEIESVANWQPTDVAERFCRLGALRTAGAENRIGTVINPMAGLALIALVGIGSLLAVVGAIILVTMFTDRQKVASKMRGFACGPLSNVTASEFASRAALFLFLYVASQVPFMFLHTEAWPDGISTLVRGSTILVVALFSAAVPLFGRGGLKRVWGRVPVGEGLQVGLGGLACNVPVLFATLPFILILSKFLPDPSHPINTELSKGTGLMESLAILMVGSVCAPIAEETVFRGLLFPSLSKLFKSPIWGGLAQAFMFASIHPQGPAAWVSLMAIGAVCAAVTYRSGAQWPSMLLHGLHNGILLLLNIALSQL